MKDSRVGLLLLHTDDVMKISLLILIEIILIRCFNQFAPKTTVSAELYWQIAAVEHHICWNYDRRDMKDEEGVFQMHLKGMFFQFLLFLST